uniref:Uncharacterized protein n=1 Tax=Siphoviridae sp. ctt1f11 TaxID=2827959 RepID=A0A8S5SCS5_9CAUD|nr:MAG TPA: hypothetical protein [Siphoviridae sp. ctt1f11]
MNLIEEVGIIKELIKEENKKQNKILGDIASSLKELNEILKNNAESKTITRWIVKIKFYTEDNSYHIDPQMAKCHLQFKQNIHYIYRRKKEAVRNRLEGSSEY